MPVAANVNATGNPNKRKTIKLANMIGARLLTTNSMLLSFYCCFLLIFIGLRLGHFPNFGCQGFFRRHFAVGRMGIRPLSPKKRNALDKLGDAAKQQQAKPEWQ